MENLLFLINSRGLIKSCDVRNPSPESSSITIDFGLEKKLNFKTIHVCTEALPNFVANHLNKINNDFILITSDSDISINQLFLEKNNLIKRLLEDRRLTTWFAQNLSTTHEKLRSVPIGIDFHTAWERPGHFEVGKVSPFKQQHNLINILSNSKINHERLFGAYCDWYLSTDRGDRIECLNKIDKSFCVFETNRVPRAQCWKSQSKFCFVISPEGVGLDCHRTWEAIALGTIPIIKRNTMSPLFDDLPVIIVDDWAEVNKANILARYGELHHKRFNYSKIFLQYWKNEINRRENLIHLELKISEYIGLFQ
jgi:hypothetical protein